MPEQQGWTEVVALFRGEVGALGGIIPAYLVDDPDIVAYRPSQ